MSAIGSVHFVFCCVAIVSGAAVLKLPKGTRWHRTLGHGYVWSMVGVVATSFSLFNLTGGLGPFHLAALVAAITIAGGMWSVLLRRPHKQWIEAHATWMAWSYVGLMAAFVAESMTRFAMPALEQVLERNSLIPAFWSVVAVATFGTVGLGSRLIKKRLPPALEGTPRAMRTEREALRAIEGRPGSV